jgi:uncharacterized protein YfaT (DUF1175 family)
MAQRLAVDGAHVVISSRKQKNVDEALNKLKSKAVCLFREWFVTLVLRKTELGCSKRL